MRKIYGLLALPLLLVGGAIGSAAASSIQDNAGLFDPAAVRKAEAKLSQVENDSGVNATIETIDSLQGEPIRQVAVRQAQRTGTEGIFILIPKREHKIDVLASRSYRRTLTGTRLDAIRDAFISGLRHGDYDAGLIQGVEKLAQEIEQAKTEHGGVLRQAAPVVPMRRGPANRGSFGLGSLLMIGLLIFAVLFGIRLLGNLFGGGQRAGYGPGQHPMGGGPGFGRPGYGYGGGGGGGFLSSMFGGIGGALAGNWLYDQFSGRHHGGTFDNSTFGGQDAGQQSETGGRDWAGGGESAGDWGGGDAGGGDWGGGGGGDWGGGGGGDWGGGGGGGGDW